MTTKKILPLHSNADPLLELLFVTEKVTTFYVCCEFLLLGIAHFTSKQLGKWGGYFGSALVLSLAVPVPTHFRILPIT